jgi:hypothetical protein
MTLQGFGGGMNEFANMDYGEEESTNEMLVDPNVQAAFVKGDAPGNFQK